MKPKMTIATEADGSQWVNLDDLRAAAVELLDQAATIDVRAALSLQGSGSGGRTLSAVKLTRMVLDGFGACLGVAILSGQRKIPVKELNLEVLANGEKVEPKKGSQS